MTERGCTLCGNPIRSVDPFCDDCLEEYGEHRCVVKAYRKEIWRDELDYLYQMP